MNVERRRVHMGGLRANSELGRAAASHARDMLAHHFFSHSSADGRSVLDRILRSGYLKRFGNWRVGENLGWGWGNGASPRDIVAAWMRSPSHRRNVLSRPFRDAGISVAIGSPGRPKRGSITYVVDFGGFG
jgi:uncharacterized protein YkwD